MLKYKRSAEYENSHNFKNLLETCQFLNHKDYSSNLATGFRIMDKTLNIIYLFKVWLLTILAGPVMIYLFTTFYNKVAFSDAIKGVPSIFLFIILGFVLSIPAFLLFILIFKFLLIFDLNTILKKILLSVVGVCLIVFSFIALDSKYFANHKLSSLIWPASYSMALVIFSISIKVPRRSQFVEE